VISISFKIYLFKKSVLQIPFRQNPHLAFDRGRILARGASGQGCRKKYYPQRSGGVEIFYSGTCMALAAEEV